MGQHQAPSAGDRILTDTLEENTYHLPIPLHRDHPSVLEVHLPYGIHPDHLGCAVVCGVPDGRGRAPDGTDRCEGVV